MFPIVELSDLLTMLRTKTFARKRGLKDVLAIASFAVDQMPDDAATADPSAPIAAHAAFHPDYLLPELELLEAMHAKHAASGAAHGLFSGVDWKSLLAKLLPLIISLAS